MSPPLSSGTWVRIILGLFACGIVFHGLSTTLESQSDADDLYRARNHQQAAAAYHEAFGADPSGADSRSLLRWADSLIRIDRQEESIPLARIVADREEADLNERIAAYRTMGRGLRDLDRTDESAAVLREALDLEGLTGNDYARLAKFLGDVLTLELGKYDQAIEVYERVEGVGAGWKDRADALGRIEYAKGLRDGPHSLFFSPFLREVGPDHAVIGWVSLSGQPAATVSVTDMEKGGAPDTLSVELESAPFRHEETMTMHWARVSGLMPRTRYAFTVVGTDGEESGSFTTAPPDGSREPIRILVYGDTQDRPEFHREVADVMAEEEADLILHTGDLVGRGDYFPHWRSQFFGPASNLFRKMPVYPAVGNHDGHRFYDNFFRRDQVYYTFTFGNVQFFSLASYRGGSVGSRNRNEQLEWLEQELKNSTADWLIAYTHYPMLDVSETHWVNWGQDDFRPLLEQYGVDFILHGHLHYYRRLPPLGPEGQKPMFHIISGGGASVGGDHGAEGTAPIGQVSPLANAYRALHYLFIEIEGDNLWMEARMRDGSVLDRMELVKRNNQFPAEVMEQAIPFEEAVRLIRLPVVEEEAAD